MYYNTWHCGREGIRGQTCIKHTIRYRYANNTPEQDSTKVCCNNDKDLSLDH